MAALVTNMSLKQLVETVIDCFMLTFLLPQMTPDYQRVRLQKQVLGRIVLNNFFDHICSEVEEVNVFEIGLMKALKTSVHNTR